MSLIEHYLARLNRSFIKAVAWDTNQEFLLTRIRENCLVVLVIGGCNDFEVEKSMFKLLVQILQAWYAIFCGALFL